MDTKWNQVLDTLRINMDTLPTSKNPWCLLDDNDYKAIAEELFSKIDTFDSDYEATIKILKDIYNRGRSRGMYENA